MGGASSRFDQTQWWNADGELLSNIDQSNDKEKHATILPGAEPTLTLEIFDILKSKSITASRDFEVKDSNKKVVYTTRAVPGTMAWFDVVKPKASATPELAEGDEEADEEAGAGDTKEDNKDNEETTTTVEDEGDKETLLLRVQSDWNRRSWTVYTLSPVFPGQLPATLPNRKGLGDDCDVYKSCCITLSWSKAFAVVARYGPPTKLQDFLEDAEEAVYEQSIGVNVAGENVEANGDSEHSLEDDLFAKAESIAAKERKKHNVDGDIVKLNQSQTSVTAVATEKGDEEPTGVIDTLAKSFKTYIDPALEHPKIQLTPEEKQRYALEGVVNLDSPLLQCQAILGKKKHYQTRLIGKEDTIKLWLLDETWNKERFLKQEDEDLTQGTTKSPLGKAVSYEISQLEKPHNVEELKQWFSNEYIDKDQRNMVKDDIKTIDAKSSSDEKRASLLQVGKSWFSFRAPQKSDGDESVATQEELSEHTDPGESAEVETATKERETKTETTTEEKQSSAKAKVYGSNHGVLESDESPDRKEPLVSHWHWRNSYTTHKMQMHLAKNSDLALHTVLSIVLNIW